MIQHINKQSEVTPFVHLTQTLNTPLSISQITICSVYLIFQINLQSCDIEISYRSLFHKLCTSHNLILIFQILSQLT